MSITTTSETIMIVKKITSAIIVFMRCIIVHNADKVSIFIKY